MEEKEEEEEPMTRLPLLTSSLIQENHLENTMTGACLLGVFPRSLTEGRQVGMCRRVGDR